MKFSFNQLKTFVDIKIKPQALADILTMKSFETTAVKNGGDWILEADVLPNRAHDCLCYLGMAAEISALTGARLKMPKLKVKEDKNLKIGNFVGVKVDDSFFCPRYACRTVSGVKVGPSPKWLKDALLSFGQKPINNIVDAANYAMFVFGQPLHAFDYDKISGGKKKEIIVRRAKNGESIVTLDNQGFLLDENVLVIADSPLVGGEPLAVAGIKGGKKAEISGKTKTIVLESANFNGPFVRKASAKLGLKTDSSVRFAAGIDPYLAGETVDYLAFLIQKVAGGKIAKGKVDIFPRKPAPARISFSPENADSVLGAEIKESEIIAILKSIGCKVSAKGPLRSRARLVSESEREGEASGSAPGGKKARKSLAVGVPARRLDLALKEDLIEEIGRIYGYDKIKAKPISGELILPKENESARWENLVKDALAAAGFSEVLNYSFVGSPTVKKFNLKTENLAALKNPISSDKEFLTPSLVLNITKNIVDNFRFFEEAKIFEINKIFAGSGGKISENKSLVAAESKKTEKYEAESFYHLKGTVDLLFAKLGIGGLWYDTAVDYSPIDSFWHKERLAEIKAGEEKFGYIGEIHPNVLKKTDVKTRVAVCEIDFEKLAKFASEEREYAPPPKFPAVVRDIAILVQKWTSVDEVQSVIETAGGKMVVDSDLFDIYEGAGLPAEKSSMAFRIVFQSPEKTLTDEEVDKIFKKITAAVEEKGWEIR